MKSWQKHLIVLAALAPLVLAAPSAAQDPDVALYGPVLLSQSYDTERIVSPRLEAKVGYVPGPDGAEPYRWRAALVEARASTEDPWITDRYAYDNDGGADLVAFDGPGWSDWMAWEGGMDAIQSMVFDLDASDPGAPVHYLLAFQVKDVNHSRSSELDYAGAVHNIRPDATLRPQLILRERILGTRVFHGEGMTAADDVTRGQELAFEWIGSADPYGGAIASYRWGWDIADVDDPFDPGWAVEPGISPEHLESIPLGFQAGQHRLTVDCRDAAGMLTRAAWIVSVVPIPEYGDRYPLLLVDDVVDHDSNAWPDAYGQARDEDAYRDAFWEDVLSDVEGWDPLRDVVDTYEDASFSYRDAVWYKTLLWSTRLNVGSYISRRFVPPAGQDVNVWLESYVADVGNLFMTGAGAMRSFTPAGYQGLPWLDPVIYDTDETVRQCGFSYIVDYALGLGVSEDLHGEPVILGRETFPYRSLGLSVMSSLVPAKFWYSAEYCGDGGYYLTRRCGGSKGVILDADFAAAHPGAALPDTVFNDASIDWYDPLEVEDFPYAFGGNDEFFDLNATSRPTEWNPQTDPGSGERHVIPMWRTYNRYDWLADYFTGIGEDFPGDIDVASPFACGPWTVDPATGRTRTAGAVLGLLTTKSIEHKPLHRADVLWGFDPHRLDHARMRQAIHWVLASHFGLEVDGYVANEDDEQERTPSAVTALRACRPNPFNPSTTVSYELAAPGRAQVAVFDLRGRRVAVLEDAVKPAGVHEVTWRGVDETGRAAAAGAYLIRLRAGDATFLRRATLLK